jgi:hypothetical protein
MFLKRFALPLAFVAIFIAACSSGSGTGPTAVFPATTQQQLNTLGQTFQLNSVNGLNSTLSLTGTGNVSLAVSTSAPIVGAIPMIKQRNAAPAPSSSPNVPLFYITVTATSETTLTQVGPVSVGQSAAPQTSAFLAIWDGKKWDGVASGTFGQGVLKFNGITSAPLPITLATGQSAYFAVYEGQQVGTPVPAAPVASPSALSIDLLTTGIVAVTTKAGFTLTATSANASIATVAPSATAGPDGVANFLVTAQGAGSTTLTFTDPLGQTGTATVTIINALPSPVPAPQNFVISNGDSTQLVVSTAKGLTITATSTSPGVATVTSSATADGNGDATFTVTGVSSGTTTLTFTDKFGDTDTAMVDVSPIKNGTFTNSTGAGTLGAWTPCSYSREVFGASINAVTAPFASGNQFPAATPAPPALAETQLTTSAVTNPSGDVAVATPPPNLNPTLLDGATPSVPSVIGNNVALTGGALEPNGGEVASLTEGSVGICQTVTLDSTNQELSFWVYEAGSEDNFASADQEAVILNSSGTAFLTAPTWTGPDNAAPLLTAGSVLFAEENCFWDPGTVGITGFPKSACIPTALGGTDATQGFQGGTWVQRGPYNLSQVPGLSVGNQYTLFLGVWAFENKATPAAPTTFGNAMFVANVQVSDSTTFPTQAPFDKHRTLKLTMPATHAPTAGSVKARP